LNKEPQDQVETARHFKLRRYVLTVVLVLLPLLLSIVALEAFALRIGETMPMWLVAKWQSAGPDREWRGGDGRSYLTYKVARTLELRPQILVVGSSRANSFEAYMFAPYSFYNAGLTCWTFDHYRRFLEIITKNGYAPKVLIFNFDYWMFAQGFDLNWAGRFYERPTTHIADLKMVVDQLMKAPLDLWKRLPLTEHYRGLAAVLTANGFRADGSLFGQPQSPDPNRLLHDDITVGVPPVVLADHISPEQVTQFQRFVAVAKAHHIALIGIQVPYYVKVLNGLDTNPKAGIWREFQSAKWRRFFDQSGMIFFDFADMPGISNDPQYFIDSVHPDARVIRAVMKIVFRDPRVRAVLPKPEEKPR